MSNHARLLKYLKNRKSATPLQIRNALGISNVADAVLRLRNQRHDELREWFLKGKKITTPDIKTTMVKGKNRYGGSVWYAKYSLEK